MKWKDLSLKERKQIYDSVRVNNPGATYFDIKQQFDSIPTYEDGKDESVAASFSLPEVTIYPQNRFGDIARTQGYETAKNWKKVKEGTTAGINTFINSPHAQFVQTMLPLPDGLEHLGIGTDIEYRKFLLPDLWKDIEAGKILRGKPFTVKNTIEALEGIDLDGTYITPLSDTNVKSIPKYQDGKGKTINKADLPPEYRTGTPEYFERQRKISGAVNTVQPEAYITPAGYIKDAVNFIEDLGKGDYAGAAIDAALNLIPWGVGKGIKKLKSKVGRIVEGTEIDGASVHSFAPTQTKKKTKKKTEEDYDSEFSEVLRKDRNSKKYQQEISRTIEQAIFPDERTRGLVENVDKTYGTNYKRAYSNIAYKDMTKRGSYVKWGDTDKDGYGQINIKNIKDNVLPTDINDYSVILDNNIYMPGTANHELGHVADGLAGSRKIQDFDSGKEYITNTYLNYLANSNNTYSSAELRKMGLFDAAGSRSYLLNPTEAKSHMLTLKRSLKDSGKITNWSTPVDENMILEYMRNPTSNKMVKNQYDLYRNKNEYIDRLNKLIPMEILMPLGGAGFVGHELNKE